MASYSYDTLLIDVVEGVAKITLNRPDKRNAMSPTLHVEMTDVLERLRYDDAARVLIITGAGKAFCAGMDLKEFFSELNDKPAEQERIFRIATEWRGRTLRHFPKPTIAAINGYCFGGAFSLVEGCDIAVAANDAIFGLSEVNFGVFPGGNVSKALSNLMRPRDALFYGLTGRQFDGKRAAEMGFVTYAVPSESLSADVLALARDLASKNGEALRATKEGYHYSIGMDWDSAIAYADARQGLLTLRQKGAWFTTGVGDFLKGEFKPGQEANAKLGGANGG